MITCPSAPHTHSISEVCELIGCDSEDWFVDRVRSGGFPAHRMVRTLRFTHDDIEGIINACAVAPGPRRDITVLTPTSRRKAG